ncbi:MAG: tetratricopeptide repeat protein [Bacteroidales bacterium]|nr:tetratricopeptide repeat protein [Bacteroidales bacterium]
MKKVMILLVIALTANVMMAQKKDRTDAFMYNRNGQYEKAMVSIEKCVNHEQFLGMKPNDQCQAWLYRASIYQNILQSGDEALIAKAPNALEIVYESLMKCLENDDFMNDSQNQMEVATRIGSVLTSYYSQGADDYNNGKYAEAAPLFKKAYDIAKSLGGGTDAGEMLNLAATSALRAEDYTTALAYFNELKNNGTETAEVYRHLAACYNGMGQPDQAMAMINAGLEKDPSDANLILEKVNAYLKEGKGAEAVADLNKLHELDPENAQLLFVLGTIYGDENNKDVFDTEKAKQYYEQALAIKPDYYDAIYNIGVLYTGMANKYIEQANEITGFSKKEQEEYNNLIEQANGLLRTGLPYLQQAYEAQPSDDVKNVLRSIYVKLNMTDEVKALDGRE